MYLYSAENTVTLEFFNYFLTKDWSAFKTFEAEIKNGRAVELTVKGHIRTDGEWKEIAPLEVAPGTIDAQFEFLSPADGIYKFSLADYDLTDAEGIRLTLTARGGVDAAVNNIKLTTDDSPVAIVDPIKLAARGRGSKTLESALVPTGNNAVTFKVNSSVPADVLIGLKFGDATTYARRTLVAGENDIVRLLEVEMGEIPTASLTEITVENQEYYPVALSITNAAVSSVSSVDVVGYAKNSKSYGIAYDEEFEVPNPFLADDRYYSDLSISLEGDGLSEAKTGLSVGTALSSVGTDALAAGDYTLKYSFRDALDTEATIEYSVRVGKKLLALNIELPVLYLEETTLDEPDLSSDVADITAAIGSGIDVKSYYRERGRSTWNALEGNTFTPDATKWYQFRYVADYDAGTQKLHREKIVNKFVHKNAYTFDFEQEDAATNTITTANGQSKARFLHDGGYYYPGSNWENPVFEVTSDWSVSGDSAVTVSPTVESWMGWLVAPVIKNEIGINAVRFTANSSGSFGSGIEIDSGGWKDTEPFDIYAGSHDYLVFFPEATQIQISQISQIIFYTPIICTLTIDDFELVHINELSLSKETYEDTYDMSKPYEVKRPALSSDTLTASELDAAVWELSYTLDGGERKVVTPSGDNRYAIDLGGDHGTVAFTWKATVGDLTVTDTYTVVIGEVRIEVDVPVSGTVGTQITFGDPVAADESAELKSLDIEYRHQSNSFEEWSGWTKIADNAFTPAEAGLYEIKFEATYDVAEAQGVFGTAAAYIFVREENNNILDFEPVEGSEYNFGESNTAYGTYNGVTGEVTAPNYTLEDALLIDDTYSHSGRYSMRFTVKQWNNGYANLMIPLKNVGTFAGLRFWAYTEKGIDIPFSLEVAQWSSNPDNRVVWYQTENFTLTQGWNEIEVNFTSPADINMLYCIIMSDNDLKISQIVKYIWFDDFEFIPASNSPIAASASINEEAVVGPVALSGEAPAVAYGEEGMRDCVFAENDEVAVTPKETCCDIGYQLPLTTRKSLFVNIPKRVN